jgi:hypothetical protein
MEVIASEGVVPRDQEGEKDDRFSKARVSLIE